MCSSVTQLFAYRSDHRRYRYRQVHQARGCAAAAAALVVATAAAGAIAARLDRDPQMVRSVHHHRH